MEYLVQIQFGWGREGNLHCPSGFFRNLATAFCLLVWVSALAEGKTSLLVDRIVASPSLEKKLADEGKSNRLNRCIESVETQLTHLLSVAPGIRLLGEAESKRLRNESASGGATSSFDLDDPAVRVKLNKAGARYVLKIRVTTFEEESEAKAQTQVQTQTYAHRQAEVRVRELEGQLSVTKGPRRRQAILRQLTEARRLLVSQGTNSIYTQDKRSVVERRFAIQANAQLFDSIGGEVLSAASYEIKTNSLDATVTADVDKQDLREDLGRVGANSLARKLAAFSMDVLDPMIVLKVDKDTVTLNRGEQSDVVPGQMLGVYLGGEVLKDPVTGKAKGQEERVVGRVRILEVGSTSSKARIVEEKGIAIGARLRRIER